ncbi:hypothetical protein F5888DRAFT_1738384, partial [Russula emetica]
TQTERLMKIYDLPMFSSTLEFLTILTPLSTGRILKVGTPDILSAARHVLIDWNHKKKFHSSPSCPRCTPRIYPRQDLIVAGKLHQARR